MLLNTLVSGGIGMALDVPAEEIEGAESRRRELYGLLGDLPPRERPISARTLSVEERARFVLEKLMLDVNGLEPVPAYFVKPKQFDGKAPAILFNHCTRASTNSVKTRFCAPSQATYRPTRRT
jgi:hypothetical protein